jgi:Protein of unknown function (DUF1460)
MNILPGNSLAMLKADLSEMAVEATMIDVRPASSTPLLATLGGIPCQLELGHWPIERIDALIAGGLAESIGERVTRIARSFIRLPFLFESRRPLPPRHRLPVRFDAFDCFTFVLTVLALASARSVPDFVQRLADLRYSDPSNIDSHPETGTVLDFVEEALLLKAVGGGILRDITAELGQRRCRRFDVTLSPVRRSLGVDPHEMWATPKMGKRSIGGEILGKESFAIFEDGGFVRAGDILLMSRRGGASGGHLVDHVGFVDVVGGVSHILHCTRNFAFHPSSQPQGGGSYTRLFYDRERRREQIGVGIPGNYVGDRHSFMLRGASVYGYSVGERRSLRDYLEATFSFVVVLRPVG